MITTDHQPRKHVYRARAALWWRRSWLTSTVGHGLLALFLATDIALLCAVILGLSSPPPGPREPIVLEVQFENDDPEPMPQVVVDMQQYEPEEFFPSAEAIAGRLDFSDPALQQPLDYDYEAENKPDAPVSDMQRFVRGNLDAAIEQASAQSVEENLDRLDELADRLQSGSSEESVNSVTTFVGNLIGTQERATRPAEETVAGPFDTDTGQIDDVIRRERDPEGYIYVAIMVDAEGRKMEVILHEPEGKQAYDTFEKIKQYPFLDNIYRGVVMSLLDSALKK